MTTAHTHRPRRAPVSVVVQVRQGRALCDATVLNISEGGVFLALSPPIPIGSGVGFRIAMGGEALTLRGHVRWTRSLPAGPDQPIGSGVELYDPDGRVAASLRAAIHRLGEGG